MDNLDKWVGLVCGIAIIITGLALGAHHASSGYTSPHGPVSEFFRMATVPVALGVLIIVTGNIAVKLGNLDNRGNRDN